MTVENEIIFWQNNLCLPIKLIFGEKTPKLTKQVVTNIEQQISKIEQTNIEKDQ